MTSENSAESITVEGREYRVERIPPKDGDEGDEGRGGYLLHGPRGARYRTMRNVNTPHLMFLINDRGFTMTRPDAWLSDKDGSLRVVKLLRA